jgi:RNA polymerase sigma-32 factor
VSTFRRVEGTSVPLSSIQAPSVREPVAEDVSGARENMTRKTKTDSSAVDQYLREIDRVALLTVAEEQRLAREFRDRGDKRAGHRLVEANLRFVVKVAFEYRWYGLHMPDLIQEGNIGLMKAVQKFDPDKQIRLISYAVWWIRAYIQNHVLKSWSLVKIGTTQAQRKLFFSLARTRREIERLSPGAGLDEQGSRDDLVAKKLKVRVSEVVDMQQRLEGRDFSLDAPVRDGASTHLETTASGAEPQDEELARLEEQALIARCVADAMGRLDPRERHIVEARFMGEGMETLRDLGRHFGFSRERARQLEIRAREKLRRDLAPVADEVGWPVSSSTDTDR